MTSKPCTSPSLCNLLGLPFSLFVEITIWKTKENNKVWICTNCFLECDFVVCTLCSQVVFLCLNFLKSCIEFFQLRNEKYL